MIETADVARLAPLPSDRRRTSDGTVEVLIQGRTTTPLQTRRYFAILDATVERVRATGFDNAKVQDIAADSGVALATVYRYFSSRDYLLHVALSRWLVEVNNSVVEPWREGQQLEAHLVTTVRASAAALIEEPVLLKAWARSNLSPDPCVVQLAHKGRLSDLAELYPERMRDSVLRRDLTVQMEHAWFSGMVRWSLGQRDWEDVPRDVERAMLLVLNAHRDSVDLR